MIVTHIIAIDEIDFTFLAAADKVPLPTEAGSSMAPPEARSASCPSSVE
jgi:hypothetical protein